MSSSHGNSRFASTSSIAPLRGSGTARANPQLKQGVCAQEFGSSQPVGWVAARQDRRRGMLRSRNSCKAVGVLGRGFGAGGS